MLGLEECYARLPLAQQPWQASSSAGSHPAGGDQHPCGHPGTQQHPAAAAAAAAHARAAPPPLAALLPGRHPQQQRRTACSQGCMHCIVCIELRSYRHCLSGTRPKGPAPHHQTRSAAASSAEEWWPSGLSTPTLYFHLRRRQLHLQYRQAATPEGGAKLWRPTSDTCNDASPLLAARGCRPLGLLIPTLYTNVHQTDSSVQLVGIKTVPLMLLAPHASVALAASQQAQEAQQAQQAQQQQMRRDSSQLQLLICCSKDLPRLPSAGREQLAPPAAGAANADAAAAALAAAPLPAAAKRGTLELCRTASLTSPAKRTRVEAAPVRRRSSAVVVAPAAQQVVPLPWWLAAQQNQAGQQQQHLALAQHAQHAEQQQQQQQARAHAQQAAAAAAALNHLARHNAAASPAPSSMQSSQLSTPVFPLSASQPASAAGGALAAAAALSSRSTGSYFLAPAHSQASFCLTSTSSAASDVLGASGSAALSATSVLPAQPPAAAAAAAAVLPAGHQDLYRLLDIKAQRAVQCPEVAICIHEQLAPAPSNLLSALSRLASTLGLGKP